MVSCISNPVYHIAPEMRCAETGDPGSRDRAGRRQVPGACRIWGSPEVARLCKRADENRAARDLRYWLGSCGPGVHRDRSRNFSASSCALNRLLRDGPLVATSRTDQWHVGTAYRPHIRAKGGEYFGSNGKWNVRFRCRASAGRRLASSYLKQQRAAEAVCSAALTLHYRSRGLVSVLNSFLSPTAGKNKKTATGHDQTR
jgi:hypothetical protein